MKRIYKNVYSIALIATIIPMPGYGMVDRSREAWMGREVASKAWAIIDNIDEKIAHGRLKSEEEIYNCLEEKIVSCSGQANISLRVLGYCITQYSTLLGNMPLRVKLNESPTFYVQWHNDKPQCAYMVDEQKPHELLIWEKDTQNAQWANRYIVALAEHERDRKINFVGLTHDNIALGIYTNIDDHNHKTWLRLYKKKSGDTGPNTDSWAEHLTIPMSVGGDIKSCGFTHDLQQCAVVMDKGVSSKINVLRKRESDGAYYYVWGYHMKNFNIREIVDVTPTDITFRANVSMLTLFINSSEMVRERGLPVYKDRSIKRLIAYELAQKYQKKSDVTPDTPSITAPSFESGDEDDEVKIAWPISQEEAPRIFRVIDEDDEDHSVGQEGAQIYSKPVKDDDGLDENIARITKNLENLMNDDAKEG